MHSIEAATDKLKQVLTRMGVEAEVVGSDQGDHFALEIRGDETGLVIGKKGATLDALQYLVNKMGAHGPVEEGHDPDRKPIYLDAEGYRQRRAESLTELAHQLADKARQTRRPVAVEPMSPADRRIIHMALAGQPGLTTRSEGEGMSRRLMIVPDPKFDFGPEVGNDK